MNCFQNQTRPVLEKYKAQLVKASSSFQIYGVFKMRNSQRKRFFLLEILQDFSLKSPRKKPQKKIKIKKFKIVFFHANPFTFEQRL